MIFDVCVKLHESEKCLIFDDFLNYVTRYNLYNFFQTEEKTTHNKYDMLFFMWTCLGFSVNCFPFGQDSHEK